MVFTPEQRVELTKAFDAGLQTTGKSVASEITQLSEKLSLSADAIKVAVIVLFKFVIFKLLLITCALCLHYYISGKKASMPIRNL